MRPPFRRMGQRGGSHPAPLQMRSSGDQSQDLLGEGDHDAAGQSQKTVGALGGIMAGEGQTHLDDAPAQQDQTYGADQAKDEIRQVVDDRDGIARGKGMDAQSHEK